MSFKIARENLGRPKKFLEDDRSLNPVRLHMGDEVLLRDAQRTLRGELVSIYRGTFKVMQVHSSENVTILIRRVHTDE